MLITTDRLSLTPLDPDKDAQGMHAAFGDPAVMAWWTNPVCADVAGTRRLLSEEAGRSGAQLWTIRDLADDAVVGMTGLLGGVTVPGVTWVLRKSAWGNGFVSEAAAAVVKSVFERGEVDRVEAWVETANLRSLAVCHRLGFSERGRLGQRYQHRDRPHETIVMGKSKNPETSTILQIEPVLPVANVERTVQLLSSALGCRTSLVVGDPVTLASVTFGPWSVGPSIRLIACPWWRRRPVTLNLDTGTEFDSIYRKSVDSGAKIVQHPTAHAWGTRDFVVRLSEGHRIVISGPL